MAKVEKIEVLSHHRGFARNYTPEELMGEIINLVNSDDYEDFMFVAAGEKGLRSIRIGSRDRDLRKGDLLLLNKYVEEAILE
jgi:hypothetical protein